MATSRLAPSLGGIGRGQAVAPVAQPSPGGFSDTANSFSGGTGRGGGGNFDREYDNERRGGGGGFRGGRGGGRDGERGGDGSGFGGRGFGSNDDAGGRKGGFGGGGGFGATDGDSGTRNGFGGNDDGGGGRSFGGGARGGRGGGGDRTCHKCNQAGHIARDCPDGGGGGGGGGGRGGGTCYKCGETGHFARECPSDEKGGGGKGGFGGGGGGGGGFSSDDGGRKGGGGGGFGSSGGGFGGGGGGGGFGAINGDSGTRNGFGDDEGGSRGGGFGSSRGGGRSGGGDRTCRKCNQPGHIAKDCPDSGGTSAGCYKCGQHGHISRDCPEAGGGGGGGGGGRFNSNDSGCRRCGSKEHQVRECPEPQRCFNCNETGHAAKECTKPRAPREDGQKGPQMYIPKEMTDEELLHIERIHTGINFQKYDNIEVQVTGGGSGTIPLQFEDAGFVPEILENVRDTQWSKPTPIQKYAIPVIMYGHDLMACAQTGSGKTAAFLLPMLSAMVKRGELTAEPGESQKPAAIIMSPTRELAIQISSEAKYFARRTRCKVRLIYGGTNVQSQKDQVNSGCDILVATPGRLNQFINEGRIALDRIRYVVLDEADRMLDLGFESEVRRLISHTSMPLAADRQTLMFSATFPSAIQTLAQDFLRSGFSFIAVGIIGGANTDILQEFEQVDSYGKKERLVEILNEFLSTSQKGPDGKYEKKTLVFVERKRVADFIASYLSEVMVPATSIHGDREQRQREEALCDFKFGRCPVLIATAVAARGLDIKGVDLVINYDLPSLIDDYVHRIGRTGRVGNPGRATSFFDEKTDVPIAKDLVRILADAQQTVPSWLENLGSGTVTTFTTERNRFGGQDQRETGGGWNSGSAGAGFAGASGTSGTEGWD